MTTAAPHPSTNPTEHTEPPPRPSRRKLLTTIGCSTLAGGLTRGSAKSGQVVGWVMSLMARLGRLDRDLAVEAMETPGPRKRRMRPGGQVP